MALYLQAQYPGDVGVWCVYFLNVAQLVPGQALALDANIPHAYIKGQVCLPLRSNHFIQCFATRIGSVSRLAICQHD